MHFLQQFSHRGDMYSCFLFVIQSRVLFHFAWYFVLWQGGRVNFIFECAGGRDIFVPGRATYEPRLPLYRGAPPALLPPALSRQTAHKKIPPPGLLHLQPVPGFPVSACCWFRPAAPAVALLLAPTSLNTYLANHKFTHYRSFVVASGCSASILYPHRSRLRL